MLYLISLGLADEKDLSLRALEICKKCDKLYLELYTNKMDTTPLKLSELIGKEVIHLERKALEEDVLKIIEPAKTMDVGILVGGDALTATTHFSILMEARRLGIKVRVIHSSSIFTAIGETGLQVYKFGAATTLVWPEGNYKPTSAYDTVLKNKKLGLHSLILLDIKPPKPQANYKEMEQKCMTVGEALEIILDIEKEKGKGLFLKETKLIVACRLGREDQIIKYERIEDLAVDEDLENTPAVLILPGGLHFLEEEYLNSL